MTPEDLAKRALDLARADLTRVYRGLAAIGRTSASGVAERSRIAMLARRVREDIGLARAALAAMDSQVAVIERAGEGE